MPKIFLILISIAHRYFLNHTACKIKGRNSDACFLDKDYD